MQDTHTQKYNGDIVAGSLLIMESRKIARLLLDDANPKQWHQAIMIDNILQKRTPAAAQRQARLIKNRLLLMKPALWEFIAQGSSDMAVQGILAAAIKHSHLLGDFMDTVIRQHWRTFVKEITDKDWKDFFETCAQVDPDIDQWADSTQAKIKQVIFRILSESKYIDNTKSLQLLPVSVIPEIRQYLIKNSEKYVLRCMEVTH